MKEEIKKMIEKMHTVPKEEVMDSSEFIVVTRVEDFEESSNYFWNDEGNKSYARENLICFSCKSPVVMSSHLFEQYSKNPKPEKILCGRCLLRNLKATNEQGNNH